MSKLANQWIDLFRAGEYGEKGSFTEADLQQIVDSYQPGHHEAPACIGHPKDDAPAYGWWSKLRRVGDLLQGQMRDAQPAFEEAVEKKLFKKRSVSLYKGPNGYSLRHVGFLGAQPPEIKGLADIKFEQADKEAIEIEFSEESEMAELNSTDRQSIVTDVIAGLKNFFNPTAKPGDVAPKTFSETEVADIATKAANAAVVAATAAADASIKALETKFSERETSLATAETTARAEAAIARVKGKGAWVPAFDRMGVPLVFAELAKTTVTIEFGEGEAKKKVTPLEALTTFMEGLKQIVPNSEVYTGQAARTSPAGTVHFTESDRVKADPNSVLFAEAINGLMKKNPKLTWREASAEVRAEHPELTVPGGASAGSV